MRQQAKYGSWKSPITAEAIVAESIGLGGAAVAGDRLFWLEGRPQEGGRQVIVERMESGETVDRLPAPFNARTRVHEYGGGAYFASQDKLYFSNFSDQRLYELEAGSSPKALTPEAPYRYADGVFDSHRGRLILVREDHSESDQEAANTISAVDLSGQDCGTPLVSGSDFYACPRLDAKGERLCWLQWDHPNMPWDGTELWIAQLNPDGSLKSKEKIAGGVEESVFQPEWAADGSLIFVSDRTGWWNLYRWQSGKVSEPLYPAEAEFGLPLWQFGMSTYAQLKDGKLICCFTRKGLWQIGILDPQTKKLQNIETPFCTAGHPVAYKNGFVFEGASAAEPTSLVYYDLSAGKCSVLKKSTSMQIPPSYLSKPEVLEFPTKGGVAYGFYYPPQNGDFEAPAGTLPPLLVKSHGGPTTATTVRLNPGIQFWTSRGFAVLDVNYGGSTGYGREYMKRLEGNWGVVDVQDCAAGARFLVEKKKADPNQLAIFGGSAGGYTTLCALTFTDEFKAGASHYGIGDLEALVRDTHKFESRYLDRLIGPYPEQKGLYQERSPLYSADRLSCPVIFFQGLEDKVVPPNQAESMVAALKKKGIPVEYVPFEGEQHGFRKAESIKTALNRELAFYGKVFGFATQA
ncbi:MAG: S9 family peptidase [Bdellovibrionaceae bacterium]|nr:S9 family peptidase [Bdellovibrionales bacterium]MCB9254406.1 S9 family peptidase [Pseudobdellovibrionaceae bacterium]